jgi:hypothetical protein
VQGGLVVRPRSVDRLREVVTVRTEGVRVSLQNILQLVQQDSTDRTAQRRGDRLAQVGPYEIQFNGEPRQRVGLSRVCLRRSSVKGRLSEDHKRVRPVERHPVLGQRHTTCYQGGIEPNGNEATSG